MKNTMKRLSVAILAIIMICSMFVLISCDQTGAGSDDSGAGSNNSGTETAYTLVNAAMQKTTGLDSYGATMEMNIKTSAPGMTVEIPMTMEITASGLKGNDPLILTNTTMSMMGMEITSTVFEKGEWIYTSTLGENMKIKASDYLEQSGQSSTSDSVAGLMQMLPENILKEVKIKKTDAGLKYIEVALDEASIKEIFKDALSSSAASEGASLADLDISNANVSITVGKDGYVDTYSLTYKMDMTVEDISTSSEVEMTMKFNDPGKSVTVTPPEGYESYPEAPNFGF